MKKVNDSLIFWFICQSTETYTHWTKVKWYFLVHLWSTCIKYFIPPHFCIHCCWLIKSFLLYFITPFDHNVMSPSIKKLFINIFGHFYILFEYGPCQNTEWPFHIVIFLYQIIFVACSHRKIYNITITIGEGRLSVCNIQ